MQPVDVREILPGRVTSRNRPSVRRGELVLTYAALEDRVANLAQALAATARGTMIGVRMGNEPAFVVAVLACFAAHRPVVLLDVLWSDAELEHGASRLDVGLLLQVRGSERCELATSIFSSSSGLLNAEGSLVEPLTLHAAEQAERISPVDDRNDVALVLWSSGSTGQPKPIFVPHDRLAHRLGSLTTSLRLEENDRTLCILPLSHCHGIECLALTTLLAGAELVLMDPMTAHPAAVAAAIDEGQITVFSALPRFYDQLLHLPAEPGALSSLRIPMCGSAALAPQVSRAFAQRFGVKIGQGYGLTEIGVVCLNWHEDEPVRFDSVGRVLPGIEWRVDDPDENGVGELQLRSKGRVVAGHAGERATAGEDPDGWMATADLVRADADDYLYVVGRRSSFINVNGAKADPREIERVIGALPWVAECAVAPLADERGVERVAAYVVAAPSPSVEHPEEAVQLRVAEELSLFKVPSVVVLLESLPRTSLGKVRYGELPGAAGGAPTIAADVLPTTTAERDVAAAWCEALGCDQVSRSSSFTSLGGDSVRLVQLLELLQGRFDRELSVVDLFRYPTVETQASFLSGAPQSTAVDEARELGRRQREARSRRRE